MEITLEKIELVKDRTGVTYAEAKKALEDADGSVVDAIIAIEETVNSGGKGRGFGEKGEALFKSLKDLIKKGNVVKILVKRGEEIILNIPVNVGIVGICMAPLASVVAIVAAFGFKCTVEVVKTDGTKVDVSNAVADKVAQAAEYGTEKFEEIRTKGMEYYEKAKDSDIIDKAKDAAADIKEKAEDIKGDIKEKAEDIAGKVVGEAEEFDMSDALEEEDEDVNVEVEIEEETDEE